MAKKIKLIAILFVLIAVALVPLRPMLAAEEAPDVRVVIDVSGSMKSNDPQNLRRPAVELLVELLPDGGKAGVWTFGKYVNMLVPHKPISNSWRKGANKKASEINSVALFTNIGEALEKATYDHQKIKPGYHSSLIVLTDGMVDVSRDPKVNEKERSRIVNELIPRFQAMGVKVHTIALSDNADHELLERLAVTTDGLAAVAENADELMKIFVKALDQAAPQAQVPLKENKFLVDSSIEEFTALIYRKPGSQETQVEGPDGTIYSQRSNDEYMAWFHGDAYDLITIKQPLEGEWQLKAEMDPDNRVTIVSNLDMDVGPISNNLFLGEVPEVTVQLKEDGKTITRRDFLSLLDVAAFVERDEDQEKWVDSLSELEVAPKDGIYRDQLSMLNQPGTYHLRLNVDGKTFERNFTKTITVREPYQVSVNQDNKGGNDQFIIRLIPLVDDVDVAKTQATAGITAPNGQTETLTLLLGDDQVWQKAYTPQGAGDYRIQVAVDGRDSSGQRMHYEPTPLEVSYSEGSQGLTVAAAKPGPVLEPVEEVAEVEKVTVTEPPKIEPAKPVVEEKPEIADAQLETLPEEEGRSWALYGALGVGNLLLLMAGAYVFIKTRQGPEDEELAALLADDPEEETVVNTSEPTPEAPSEPEPESETETEINDDGVMELDALSELNNDDTGIAPPPEDDFDEDDDDDPLLTGFDDEDDDDDDDFDFDADDEYSLDDFAIDDDDDDDEEEDL